MGAFSAFTWMERVPQCCVHSSHKCLSMISQLQVLARKKWITMVWLFLTTWRTYVSSTTTYWLLPSADAFGLCLALSFICSRFHPIFLFFSSSPSDIGRLSTARSVPYALF